MASEKKAKANVEPVRQRSQYTCMATSLSMCLKALGIETDEDEVNKVMGARPMKGARWEEAFAAAQHFGARATLVTPCTVQALKEWTDAGTPVMISWNPEKRDWSHASVVFDITEENSTLMVHVADPNIPNPSETVRVISEDEFYGKWAESWDNYMVRRVAMAVEREITPEGRQVMASAEEKTMNKNAKTIDTLSLEQWMNNLSPGDLVQAYWTAGSGGHYNAKARVKKVNRKSVVVELLEEIRGYSTFGGEDVLKYPKGHKINLPTYWGDRTFKVFFNAPMPIGVTRTTPPKRKAADIEKESRRRGKKPQEVREKKKKNGPMKIKVDHSKSPGKDPFSNTEKHRRNDGPHRNKRKTLERKQKYKKNWDREGGAEENRLSVYSPEKGDGLTQPLSTRPDYGSEESFMMDVNDMKNALTQTTESALPEALETAEFQARLANAKTADGAEKLFKKPYESVEKEYAPDKIKDMDEEVEKQTGSKIETDEKNQGKQASDLERLLTAALEVKKLQGKGLYGYNVGTQRTVEATIRKATRRANKIAKALYKKDPRTAAFLGTHAKRTKSASARILVACMKNLGPKFATETEKTAGLGMYGMNSKTAKLALAACTDVTESMGQLAYDLHARKASRHERITGFLGAHSKSARCLYAKMLLASYPEAATILTAAEDKTADKCDNMPNEAMVQNCKDMKDGKKPGKSKSKSKKKDDGKMPPELLEKFKAKKKADDEEAEESKEAKFEKGKPADPTENMTEEQKKKWMEHHGQIGNKKKAATKKLRGKKLRSFINTTYSRLGNRITIDMMSIPKIWDAAQSAYESGTDHEDATEKMEKAMSAAIQRAKVASTPTRTRLTDRRKAANSGLPEGSGEEPKSSFPGAEESEENQPDMSEHGFDPGQTKNAKKSDLMMLANEISKLILQAGEEEGSSSMPGDDESDAAQPDMKGKGYENGEVEDSVHEDGKHVDKGGYKPGEVKKAGPEGFPFSGRGSEKTWVLPGGEVEYRIGLGRKGPGTQGGGLTYFGIGANTGKSIGTDRYHWDTLVGTAIRHAMKHHPDLIDRLDGYTKARVTREAKSTLRPEHEKLAKAAVKVVELEHGDLMWLED